jgi:hypothetical protein
MLPFDFTVFLVLGGKDDSSTSALLATFLLLVTRSPGVEGLLEIFQCTRLEAMDVTVGPGDISRFLSGETSSVLSVFLFFFCLGFFAGGLGLISAASTCNVSRFGSILLRVLLVLLSYNMEEKNEKLLKVCKNK